MQTVAPRHGWPTPATGNVWDGQKVMLRMRWERAKAPIAQFGSYRTWGKHWVGDEGGMMGTVVSERETASGYRNQVWCYIPNPNTSLVSSSKKRPEKPCHPTAPVSVQPQEPGGWGGTT